MRPRFRLEVPLAPDAVHARLRSQLDATACPCRAVVRGDHVEVMIREELLHFWSPRLSLEIEPHAEGATLQGLFGPAPHVWTMFLAAYAFLGLTASFAGMLGLVQLGLGQTPWGLWVACGALVGGVLPYLGSQVGQGLAAEQMELLREFLSDALGVEA